MARPKMQSTKYEILQCATRLFLEKGYADTVCFSVGKRREGAGSASGVSV